MSSPDDKTVMVHRSSAPDGNGQHALPAGTRIGELKIIGPIGEGGFGTVYLAYDMQLGRNVAIKEYIPAALASRVGTAAVSVRSERHEDTFRAGLRSFINEVRLLAGFDHHSLVKVYRFLEANGTAYIVMPFYDGITLREGLRTMSGPPDEAVLLELLTPLIEALAVLHAAQCYHRDIAPDNIMLFKGSSRPLLLDFGAARRVIGDMTQALTVILKPGYAPVAQYAEEASMKQGAWTDVHALAAVVYFAIQGKRPPTSVGRLMNDTYAPLAVTAAGRYADRFLRAIGHALAVRPENRPPDVQAFAKELGISIDTPAPAALTSGGDTSGARRAYGSSAAQTSATSSRADGESMRRHEDGGAKRLPPATPADDSRSRRAGLIIGAAVCIVAPAGGGTWMATRSPPAPATAAPRAAPVVAEPPPRASLAVTAASIASTPTPSISPPSETLTHFTPGGELERIEALADRSIHVHGALRSTTARIGKDPLQFRLSSNRAGYVYVFMVDPANQYLMLFPNGLDRNNMIAAGQTVSLPRASWPMLGGEPPGPNRFLVLVSLQPRDFSAGGLKPGVVCASFPDDAQHEAATRRTPQYSPFADKPRCPADAPDRTDAFGGTRFTIDAVRPAG